MNVTYQNCIAQIKAIFVAWGMSEISAQTTADVLSWADVHGVDSHGMSMLTEYDIWQQNGRINARAVPAVVQENPVSAVIDGKGGFGHLAAHLAMRTAIAKAGALGVGVVAVRNSSHFGACGYFAKMASDQGLIGYIATSVSGIRVAPTGGKKARLGTDPFAFAAPAADDTRPFLLDMATTTVAAGRVRNKANEGMACPPGWVLDHEGRASTDPNDMLLRGGMMTSLGGTEENSSHKGYGLAVMVNILSSCLSGATLITDPQHTKKPQGMDIGHFALVIDPKLFGSSGDFKKSVQSLCGDLRTTAPFDPAKPVMVAGDPERAFAAKRLVEGIPVAPGLLGKLRQVAANAGAPWLLENVV